VRAILAGEWIDPDTGKPLSCPIRSIRIAPSLDGAEAELAAEAGLAGRIAIVTDGATWAALGRRVAWRLQRTHPIDAIVLNEPHADEKTLANVLSRARHADGLLAVGAGVLNDLCKAAAARSRRDYAVFGTAASMNGFTTSTVSLLGADGVKTTRAAVMPKGVFLDLGVLAEAPHRLTRAGLGDSICRTTAQTDWLLSHILFDTPYTETPYLLQRGDEQALFEMAAALSSRELTALAALCRLLVLTGLGTIVTGTSQYGSGSEHLISHAVDKLAGAVHPGSLHGEQTGIATLTAARLQERILLSASAPTVSATVVDVEAVIARFGVDCLAQLRRKALDERGAERVNRRLDERWDEIRSRFRSRSRSAAKLEKALHSACAATAPEDIGLDRPMYETAVRYARELRDRFSILDIAGDSGVLDDYVSAGAGVEYLPRA
jgi:glycerol-1-phosphate dehydrogenase [NAD(P)+]